MNEKTWNLRLNEHPDYRHFKEDDRIPECPDWLNSYQVNTWKEQGLIIWDNAEKKIDRLSGFEAVELLRELSESDNWKTEGISIGHMVYEFEIKLPPRGRRKEIKQTAKVETRPSEAEIVFRETLHLPPEAGPVIINLLQTNCQVISKMAEQEKNESDERLRLVGNILLEAFHKREQNEFSAMERAFKWQQTASSRWSWQSQSMEGRVCLEKNMLRWHACVRKSRNVDKSDYFMMLLDAAEWVEKELKELENQPESPEEPSHIHTEQQIDDDHKRLKEKLLNGSFWIDPATIEPERVTYKIFIELDGSPSSFENYETICGDTIQINKRYPSPSKLAESLNLEFDHFHIDQPAGENTEWYQFTSLTAFYQESSAIDLAQLSWNRSLIQQQFKSGKITRARYGYQEVETGFVVYLGGCESPERPWTAPETRKNFIELLALRESLCFSLDITDYRDYLGVSSELINDEQTLQAMHKVRARSKYLPEEVIRESKVWLAQNSLL
jgi:hypothetical protein